MQNRACISYIGPTQKAPPVASRKKICRGEEAQVSRVRFKSPFFGKQELVERKCNVTPLTLLIRGVMVVDNRGKVSHELSKTFFFERPDGSDAGVEISKSKYGQFLHYYSLQLARCLFPENFPKVRALRFSSARGMAFANIYSDEVPDEGRAIQRKNASLRQYHAQDRSIDSDSDFRKAKDAAEHKAFPQLASEMKKIMDSGIVLVHPELNYHRVGDTPVFFEVTGLNMKKLISHIESLENFSQKQLARAYTALILAASVECGISNAHEKDGGELLSIFGGNVTQYYLRYFRDSAGFARKIVALATDPAYAIEGTPMLFFMVKSSNYLSRGVFAFLEEHLNFPFADAFRRPRA